MNHKKYEYLSGYFTVEASLVMPIVLGCYVFIAVLMCCIYERCILEQNACRLPVWQEYVEGYAGLYPGNTEVSGEEICRYVLGQLNEIEKDKYLFGQDIFAEIEERGESVVVERSMEYSLFGSWEHEFTAAGFIPEPTEYIRSVNLLKAIWGADEITEE